MSELKSGSKSKISSEKKKPLPTKVFIFAGTSEGRQLAEILSQNSFDCSVSVATEYGAILLPKAKNIHVLQGRLSHSQMEEKFTSEKLPFSFVIDATHPFAQEVSQEIKKACASCQLPYLRLARNTGETVGDISQSAGSDSRKNNILFFDDIKSACVWLEKEKGKIFVTSGSKEIPVISKEISDKSRVFLRVLPSVESIKACIDQGFLQKQIIAGQGPFSLKINEVHFLESGAKFLLTKESGKAGGFSEKILAAQNLGIKCLVIKNPEKKADLNQTLPAAEKNDCQIFSSMESLLQTIEKKCGVNLKSKAKKEITLLGMGMGSLTSLTKAGEERLKECDLIFGAQRMLDALESEEKLSSILSHVAKVPLYRGKEISDYLKNHPDYKKIVLLFSGDTGFYSGAASFLKDFTCEDEYSMDILPGISSPIYFASKIRKSWQNWKFLSLHGSKCNFVEELRKNPAIFLILSGKGDLDSLTEKVSLAIENQILPEEIQITLGKNLSYADEEIFSFTGKEISNQSDRNFTLKKENSSSREGKNTEKFSPLYVLLLENPYPQSQNFTLKDDDFIRREKIPMTKEEVRHLSLNLLDLKEDSIFYDIGSGSGSITVEGARVCSGGQVFAFECKEEALALTKENCKKFCLENVNFILGKASASLKNPDLPVPSHAFIGGSGGQLEEICRLLIEKNPRIQIVANFVSLEGLEQVQRLEKALKICDLSIRQVNISRAEKTGDYHILKAGNPIFIISFKGSK